MFHLLAKSAAKPFAKQQHDFRQTYEQQLSKPSKTTWLETLAKPRTTVTTATTVKTVRTVETINFDVAFAQKAKVVSSYGPVNQDVTFGVHFRRGRHDLHGLTAGKKTQATETSGNKNSTVLVHETLSCLMNA